MREVELITKVQVFENEEELPGREGELMREAHAALAKSYAPYSKFNVGSAVLLAGGQIISGANQENAAYPMCLCAERVALGAATAVHPGEPVTAIAITIKSSRQVVDHPAAPCGACRQVICETANRQGQPIVVLIKGEIGPIYRFNDAVDLLPLSFDSSYL